MFGHRKDGERGTDPVVVVRAGTVGARGARQGAQGHVLDSRLAGRAGDAHDRNGRFFAPVPGEVAQRRKRVGDAVDGDGTAPQLPGGDDRGAPGCNRVRDEGVAIEVLALDRHEDIAALQRASVGRDRPVEAFGAPPGQVQRTPHRGIAPGEARRGHESAPAARWSRTIRRSSKGRFSVPTTW